MSWRDDNQQKQGMNVLLMNSARAWGGNEKWVRLAAAALSREHNVYLAYRDDIVGSRFTIPKIRLPFRHEADIETIIKLGAFARKNRIEVLIPSKRKDYALAGFVSRTCGCLNVLRLGIVRDLKKNYLQTFLFNKLADGVIVNAEPIREKLLESGFRGADRARVIYNGLDSDDIFELAERQTVTLPFDYTVTAMGELSRRKDFETLLRGFSRFMDKPGVQNAGLVIIGEGSRKQDLQKLARSLDIERQVMFTGFLENPYPFLYAGDVFAMTSHNEGISNAVLEASLLNNAVITTASGGGITTVIRDGENGFLLEYGNDEQLAGILMRLYTQPAEREKAAENISRTVTSMFSIPEMTGKIIDFCKYLQQAKHRS